jgi:RNA polymerase sigma-70 factor (ECF subfamily)
MNRRPWWARIHASPEASLETVPAPDRRGGVDPTWIALADAFRTLPADQRAVVALHLYEGYSVEETARLMDARVETTRSRLRLARARLRRELGELREDER